MPRQRVRITAPAPLQCGECTACCYTHGVDELGKPSFTRCVHLGYVEALGREGCTIYADRPESCRKMACSWLQGKLGRGAAMRPNNFGLVASGHVDEGIGPTAHILEVTPGAVNRPDALKWFCEQTRAANDGRIQPIVLEREVGKLIYGPPELMARLNAQNGERHEETGVSSLGAANRVRERTAGDVGDTGSREPAQPTGESACG